MKPWKDCERDWRNEEAAYRRENGQDQESQENSEYEIEIEDRPKRQSKREIKLPGKYKNYVMNCSFRYRCPRAANSRWTPPTARQCKYCPDWARNKKDMNDHVKRRHFDILEGRKIEHERREKMEEKEKLLILVRKSSVKQCSHMQEGGAPAVGSEITSENWNEPEVQLEFPMLKNMEVDKGLPRRSAEAERLLKIAEKEADKGLPRRSAEAERLLRIAEEEAASVPMMEKVRESATSLERRLERMGGGEEGETCQALAWERGKETEEDEEVEKPSRTKQVAESAGKLENYKDRDGKDCTEKKIRKMVNARVQTDAEINEMARIPEETLISAADVILAITIAHPTWTEETILKLAREKRTIRKLPDVLVRLLVYTTCMTEIQMQLEEKLLEETKAENTTENKGKVGDM